jgi:UDP-N-acetyl-D-galactosamine dehydrogenase
VAVIGLGYLGLPLAAAFATPAACVRTADPLRRRVIGFDINSQRLDELRQGIDRTHETTREELRRPRYWSSPATQRCWLRRMCLL